MKASKIAVLIIFCLVFAEILFHFDYSDMSWNNNTVGYLKIITWFIILFIIRMIAEKNFSKK